MKLKELSAPTTYVPPKRKRKSEAKDPNNPSKGGRPLGALNKRTIAAIEKAKANVPAVHKLSLTSLRDTARYLGSAMAIKQPWNPDGTERPGGDYRTFMELCVMQLRYLAEILPYESTRLAPADAPPVTHGQRTVVNVTILNERGEKVYSDSDDVTDEMKMIEGVAEPGEAA
jgi:hypothetical protein